MAKIGVFDSGMGGLSVAQALERALPEHQVVFRNDSEHMPYGERKPSELLKLVQPILESLVADGCELLVIACNTVSTTLAPELRQRLSVPIVALEPMVKPAAQQTKTGVIAVCATPTTLQSSRYQELKATYAADLTVIEPDCADWARLIEESAMSESKIRHDIEPALKKQADVIVLGCTHYHWIEQEINRLAEGKATVLQPEAAIIREVTRQLERI